jgi:hypothetical protein
MRRVSVLRGICLFALITMLVVSRENASGASNIAFRGGWEDHFWNTNATFCKDGIKIVAEEIEHPDQNNQPNGRGDDKPYALVVTTTSILMDTPLPLIIGDWQGGPNHPLASATAYFGYSSLQPPTTPVSITLERWDHGDRSVIDTGEDSPGDDRDSMNGVTANCTLLTPPVFDIPPSPKNGTILFAEPGKPISFSVEGSDVDGTDSVTLSATDLPAGASFPPPAAANPAVATFSWTPQSDQTGAHVVKFSTVDATGRTTPPYSVTINVGPKEFLPLVKG